MKTYGEYRKQIDRVMGIEKDASAYIGETEKNLVAEVAELKKKLRKEQMSGRQYKNMYNAEIEGKEKSKVDM